MTMPLTIRDLRPNESDALGRLLVEVYSSLEGFPTPEEQPHYYELLANIGRFTEKRDARVLVALSAEGELMGGVVYFGDMAEYGSGGIATTINDASGIRLLGVSPKFRAHGGRQGTDQCLYQAGAGEGTRPGHSAYDAGHAGCLGTLRAPGL